MFGECEYAIRNFVDLIVLHVDRLKLIGETFNNILKYKIKFYNKINKIT